MTIAKCAYLLGMANRPRRWERPLLFFAALFVGDLVWLIVAPSINSLGESYSLKLWNFYPPGGWLNMLFESLLLTAVATMAFALIRNALAIIPLALVYGLVWIGFMYLSEPGQFSARQTGFVWFLVNQGLWVLCLFAMLELALKLVKNLLLALLIGAMTNSLLLFALNTLYASLLVERALPFKGRILFLPFNLCGSMLMALALYGGLRLTTDRAALEEPEDAPRISKGYYLGTLAAAEVVSVIISVAIIVFIFAGVWKLRQASETTQTFILLSVASLLALYAIVVFCRMVYRMWSVIQDGYARTSPGKAVGALFIPFYNLYWMFQVFPGFANDYNAFAERHALNVPRLSTGVFTAYAVLCLLAAIPYVGLLFVPAGFVVLLVMTARIGDAMNAVPFASSAPVRVLAQEAAPLSATKGL